MRVTESIFDTLQENLDDLHRGRRRTVLLAIRALLMCRRLTVTAIGRAAATLIGLADKHGIKRVDRLLSNRHLWAEVDRYLYHLALVVCRSHTRLPILVDWTYLTAGWSALIASVPTEGRALMIYYEIHPKKFENNRHVQFAFLDALHRFLPAHHSVLIVTDPGFESPWFRKVRSLGWDFLGRLSSGVYLDHHMAWKPARSFWRYARNRRAIDFGQCRVTRAKAYPARIVLYKEKPKHRHGHRGVNRVGVHPATAAYKKYQRRNRNPWLLATSLLYLDARAVVAVYQSRMQCEECFRDQKSHRFGFSFEDSGTTQRERLRVLLLLAAFAHFITLSLGQAAEAANLAHAFQANTVTSKRVLSLFFLGLRILQLDPAHLPHMISTRYRTLPRRIPWIYPPLISMLGIP